MLTKRINILLGILAGGITLGLSYIIRVYFMGLFLPEVAVQTIFTLVPGGLEALIESEQAYQFTKSALLLGSIINNLIIYGILTIVLQWVITRLEQKKYLIIALQYSLITYAATFLVAIALLQITEVLTHPITLETLLITLIPPQFAFGFSLLLLQKWVTTRQLSKEVKSPDSDQLGMERRKILRLGVVGAAAALIVFFGFNRLTRRSSPPDIIPSNLTPDSFLELTVTPNDLFYRIDINVVSPTIDTESWRLKVHGLVDNPLELSYTDLQTFPSDERYATLECISNPIGGDLISNALWKGVPLKHILDHAQVQSDAVYIVFQCGDNYDVGIPLEKGLEIGTILAYDMNGVPLPVDHGAPIRAVVPGIYGMMNAKWITEIELVSTVHVGFWQRRNWSNTAKYQTHSVIIDPGKSPVRKRFEGLGTDSTQVIVGEKVLLAGVAFAGDRGITSVEVSMDGGQNWIVAEDQEALSEGAWSPWYLEWIPPDIGVYEIVVRTVDGNGIPQIQEKTGASPDGATGYHRVKINVINQQTSVNS